jgi:hypothetical protein
LRNLISARRVGGDLACLCLLPQGALSEGDSDHAAARRIAKRYLGIVPVNGLDINLCLGGLHSAYVRGEAYLAMRRPSEAAAEFDKILEHRGIVGADPIGALVHLQLGRAFQMSNNNPAARAAYVEFLKLWKDADPDIPILKQAKASTRSVC